MQRPQGDQKSQSCQELEDLKTPFRVIIAVDMRSKNSKLLENMKTKSFGFIENEINARRTLNEEQAIDVTFTTFNDLMININLC